MRRGGKAAPDYFRQLDRAAPIHFSRSLSSGWVYPRSFGGRDEYLPVVEAFDTRESEKHVCPPNSADGEKNHVFMILVSFGNIYIVGERPNMRTVM